MLDSQESTAFLLAELKAALPFPVALTPEVIAAVAKGNPPLALASEQTVVKISYAGDEGGIMFHIAATDSVPGVVLSLTHVRVAARLPFAEAVLDYQKHRVKKLKKQRGR